MLDDRTGGKIGVDTPTATAPAAASAPAKPKRPPPGPKEDLHHRAYRFRIVETPEQAQAFARIAGCCRLVYNLGLEQRRDHGRRFRAAQGRGLSMRDQRDALPGLKKEPEAAFLADVPSHCLQEALADLDRAFRNFFAGRARYPKPRRRFENDGFRFPDARQIRLDEGNALLHLPKFGRKSDDNGPLKLLLHRKITGRIRSVTVIRDGQHWYASILVGFRKRRPKNAVAKRLREGEALRVIGLDRNVGQPIACSEPIAVVPQTPRGSGPKPAPEAVLTPFLGEEIETEAERRRTRRLQKSLARKTKGSKNRLKAKRRLASHKARLARRRRDSLRKAARAIVTAADIIVLENLQLKNMTASAAGTVDEPGTNVAQKAGLNRAMLDKGHGMLGRFIEEIAAREGKPVIFIDPRNTSRECALCHHVDARSRDGRRFRCTACGHMDHADLNAGKVIRHRATGEIARLVVSITSDASFPPVERRCQPVESSGVALSVTQEAAAARPVTHPSSLVFDQAPA